MLQEYHPDVLNCMPKANESTNQTELLQDVYDKLLEQSSNSEGKLLLLRCLNKELTNTGTRTDI